MKDILIVTINYNSSAETIAMVNSVKANPATSTIRISVVDNNSEPSDFEQLVEGLADHKEVVVTRNPINYGFGLGNLTGCLSGPHKYLFFLNNDCIVDENCIETLKAFMEENPSVSWAIPSIYSEHGQAQKAFNNLPSLRRELLGNSLASKLWPNLFQPRLTSSAKPIPVHMGSGCAMFFRREHFEGLGGFDPNLFLFGEEEDLGFKHRRAGRNVFFVPQAHVTHKMGASTTKSAAISAEFYISFFYVLRKHLSPLKATLLINLFRLKILSRVMRKKLPWSVLRVATSAAPLSHSLRHQQAIRFIDKTKHLH